MANIALSAGIRSNLVSLQQTSKLMEQTTQRLATGKKVSRAIDNPTNFFAAQSYNDRAAGLSARLDGMGEAVQQIKAADNGITAIRGILSQMKGVANDALANTDATERRALGNQFNELITQAANIAKDSGYAGINLLQGGDRTVQFHEKNTESELKISGFTIEKDADDGLTLDGVTIAAHVEGTEAGTPPEYTADEDGWDHDDYATTLNAVVGSIEDMESALKTHASKMASNLAIITQREDFTVQQINVLQEGADKLTLADMNEEGANLLALQTASQLGVQSLSLASQQSQQVLRIIG